MFFGLKTFDGRNGRSQCVKDSRGTSAPDPALGFDIFGVQFREMNDQNDWSFEQPTGMEE